MLSPSSTRVAPAASSHIISGSVPGDLVGSPVAENWCYTQVRKLCMKSISYFQI